MTQRIRQVLLALVCSGMIACAGPLHIPAEMKGQPPESLSELVTLPFGAVIIDGITVRDRALLSPGLHTIEFTETAESAAWPDFVAKMEEDGYAQQLDGSFVSVNLDENRRTHLSASFAEELAGFERLETHRVTGRFEFRTGVSYLIGQGVVLEVSGDGTHEDHYKEANPQPQWTREKLPR